jgi:predicted nucleic acid-binding protein
MQVGWSVKLESSPRTSMGCRTCSVDGLPHLQLSPDPGDNFLLALAEAGKADYLVTGDKSGLLVLASHKSTRIITARYFAAFLAADAQ